MSPQVISFNCVLKNRAGQLISSTFNRDVLNLSLGNDDILPGLTKGLQDLNPGERRMINLAAEDAYGLYDPKKVILFPKNKLLPTVKIGTVVAVKGKSGRIRSYKVLQFLDSMVMLDGNHPLAGQDLVFEIETLSVRLASQDEINDAKNPLTSQVLH